MNAINLFKTIVDYNDSKDRIKECERNIQQIQYNKAIGFMSNIDILSQDKAIGIFKSILDFKDVKDKIKKCENNISQIHYDEACNMISKTSIDSNLSAIKIFESIIDFEDSRQKIEECNILINFIKEKKEEQRLNIYNEIINNMVDCPAGEFFMVSPEKTVKSEGFLGFFREIQEAELGRSKDEIQHKVILTKSFKIGRYPVTQKEYQAVMGKNPSEIKGENRPVECVSWNEAKEFCERLNKYAKNIPQGYKFDLPTEAQWEYACRAGTTTSLNSGKNITSEIGFCINLDEVGWYYKNSTKTHPIGQKKPNAWGIYDMHGNVWEWCRDWYGDYSTYAVIDPTGPNTGSKRVRRGGSFNDLPGNCRSAFRCSRDPVFGYSCRLGFRLALVPVE